MQKNQNSKISRGKVIKKLKSHPAFEHVEFDRKAKIASINFPIKDRLFLSHGEIWKRNYDELWGIKKIKAPELWQEGYSGNGVTVAVFDTGLQYNHPDIFENLWVNPLIASDANNDGKIDVHDIDTNNSNTLEPDEISSDMLIGHNYVNGSFDPLDDHLHGTHVSGTIAASANKIGVIGVAPKAKILPIKVFDSQGGNDTLVGILEGLNSLLELISNGAIEKLIINHSWGTISGAVEDPSQSILEDAFDALTDLGAIHIVSAGNYGEVDSSSIPSSFENVITVAAGDPDDKIASFSNYGREVDIVAPGAARKYDILSGTSMASPHVAGGVALLKEAFPNKEFDDFLTMIRGTGNKVAKKNTGGKFLNLKKALDINNTQGTVLSLNAEEQNGIISLFAQVFKEGTFTWELSYKSELDKQWITLKKSNEALLSSTKIFELDTRSLPDLQTYRFKLSLQQENNFILNDYTNLELSNISVFCDNAFHNNGSGVFFILNENKISCQVESNYEDVAITISQNNKIFRRETVALQNGNGSILLDLGEKLQEGPYRIGYEVKYLDQKFSDYSSTLIKDGKISFLILDHLNLPGYFPIDLISSGEKMIQLYSNEGGQKDLLFIDSQSKRILSFYNPASRTVEKVLELPNNKILLGNYNLDSTDDILSYDNNGNFTWLNKSTNLSSFHLDLNSSSVIVDLANFDNDLESEILIIDETSAGIYIRIIDTNGSLLATNLLENDVIYRVFNSRDKHFVSDIDSDGKQNIVFVTDSRMISLEYDGSAIYQDSVTILENVLYSNIFKFSSPAYPKARIAVSNYDSFSLLDAKFNIVYTQQAKKNCSYSDVFTTDELNPSIIMKVGCNNQDAKIQVFDNSLSPVHKVNGFPILNPFFSKQNLITQDLNNDGSSDVMYLDSGKFNQLTLKSRDKAFSKKFREKLFYKNPSASPFLFQYDFDADGKPNIFFKDHNILGEVEIDL